MRVGTVSSYIFSEPREGTTGRHCVPGTLDYGSRDEKKKTDKTMKVESTGGKRERARETRKEEKKGEWMSAFRASF